jgi:hypothetical protein
VRAEAHRRAEPPQLVEGDTLHLDLREHQPVVGRAAGGRPLGVGPRQVAPVQDAAADAVHARERGGS